MKFIKFASKFLQETRHNRNAKTLLTYSTTIKFFNYVANIDIKDISKDMINIYLNSRSKSMARKDLINLRAIFNYGVNTGVLKANPCLGIPLPKLREKVPLWFSNDEFKTFISVVNDVDSKDLFTVAVYTGLRLNELTNLRKTDIYNDTIVITSLKSMKPRSIPIHPSIKNIIKSRLEEKRTIWVFTYQGYKWKERRVQFRFKKFLKLTNLNPRFHFHCLRHTFATWLIIKNIPVGFVQELLGHHDISTTMIYTHFNKQYLKDSIGII